MLEQMNKEWVEGRSGGILRKSDLLRVELGASFTNFKKEYRMVSFSEGFKYKMTLPKSNIERKNKISVYYYNSLSDVMRIIKMLNTLRTDKIFLNSFEYRDINEVRKSLDKLYKFLQNQIILGSFIIKLMNSLQGRITSNKREIVKDLLEGLPIDFVVKVLTVVLYYTTKDPKKIKRVVPTLAEEIAKDKVNDPKLLRQMEYVSIINEVISELETYNDVGIWVGDKILVRVIKEIERLSENKNSNGEH